MTYFIARTYFLTWYSISENSNHKCRTVQSSSWTSNFPFKLPCYLAPNPNCTNTFLWWVPFSPTIFLHVKQSYFFICQWNWLMKIIYNWYFWFLCGNICWTVDFSTSNILSVSCPRTPHVLKSKNQTSYLLACR